MLKNFWINSVYVVHIGVIVVCLCHLRLQLSSWLAIEAYQTHAESLVTYNIC